MTIEAEKAAARKAALAARRAANSPEVQARVGLALNRALSDYAHEPLAGYLPIRNEADPRPAMIEHSRDAAVGVPVVLAPGQALQFRLWAPDAPLEEGAFGVMVPSGKEVIVPRVVIVPMVAFDGRGYRLGYGGGFYDRTLEHLRAAGGVTAIGLAFSAQELAALPIDETDQRLDGIVTEDGLRLF